MKSDTQKRNEPQTLDMKHADVAKSLLMTQADLRWSELRYRYLLNGSKDGILLFDAQQYMVLDSNESFTAMLGHKRDELLGRSLVDIYPEQLHDLVSLADQVTNGNQAICLEMELNSKNGNPVKTEITASLIDFQSQPAVLLQIQDHTERLQSEADRKELKQKLIQSEKTLDSIMRYVPDIIYRLDPDGKVIFINDAVRRYGYEPEELIGKDILELVHHEDRELAERRVAERRTGDRRTKDLELRLMAKTMDYISFEIRSNNTIDHPVFLLESEGLYHDCEQSGLSTFLGSQGVARDITDRKLAIEAIKESEERYHALSDAALEGIVLTEKGRFLDANRAFLELFGYTQEELESMEVIELVAPESRDLVKDQLAKGLMEPYEHKALKKDGTIIDVEVSPSTALFHGRQVRMTAIRDITERKRALEAVAESEERYRTLSDASFEGIVLTEAGCFIEVNKATTEIFGYSREELIGRDVVSVISPDDRGKVAERVSAGNLEPYNLQVQHKDGHIIHVEVRPRMVRYHGRMVRLSALRDVTQQKRAEEERIRLQTAIEQTTDAVVISDHQGQIQYVNPAFEHTTGYTREEAIGETHDLFRRGEYHVDDREGLMECVTGGGTWKGRFSTLKKDGSPYEVNASISPVRDDSGAVANFVGVLRDITREATLEAQLRHSQKMEAIGGLAGGIAHDFNNLLTAIMANSELLRSQLQQDELQVRIVDEIMKISDRASLLTRQLLAFSTKQDFHATQVNLKDVIAASQNMLGRLIREDIQIKTELDPELGMVNVDPSQIEQVIMNLVLNARDAMPEGGTITIGAKNMVFEADSEYLQADMQPGDYVVLKVSDTGTGIAEEHLDRIFEPFYTTKDHDKGTGLGLATVYGIIRQSGGFINVDTDVGVGTTFYICLPSTDQPRSDELDLFESQADDTGPAKDQTAKILLVEDDESLGGVLEDILNMKGYQVLHAPDGRTALKIAQESPEAIEILVTDLLMPGMNGVELAKELSALKPDLKVLFISGHPKDVAVPETIPGSTHDFLQKPFTADKLHKIIQNY